MLKEKRNYAVIAKCGHVGLGYYIPIEFAVVASSKEEAAALARQLPRVKHHHKDAIQEVREVSMEEYLVIVERNNHDPYLKCKNIQQQKLVFNIIEPRLVVDSHNQTIKHSKQERRDRVDFKMKKNKTILNDLLKYAHSYIF